LITKLQKKTEIIRTDLKKGDVVQVVSGRDKGKEGKILQVLRKKHAVLVERLNLIKKHAKKSQSNPQGGIIEKEGMIAIPRVMMVCRSCAKPVRLAVKILADGKKLRVCRHCGEAFS